MSTTNQAQLNKATVGKWRAWLAWTMLAFATVCFALGLVFNFLNGSGLNPEAAVFFMFAPVGTLIALRRPENNMGWVYSVIGLAAGCSVPLRAYLIYATEIRPGALPGVDWVVLLIFLLATVTWITMFASLMLFPTGHFLSPRWSIAGRALIALLILSTILSIFSGDTLWSKSFANPFTINELASALKTVNVLAKIAGFILLLPCVLSIVLRFKRSKGDERQQLKWFYYSVLLIIPAFSVSTLVNVVGVFQNNPLVQMLLGLSTILIGAIPLSVAIAILSYRLYDIDLIIRRTLVYGVLTATLALVYWSGVVGLQTLLRPLTGEGNDLAIVATTLLIAALFLPLRRGIQGFIDRRFYRRKYDVAKTIAAFGDHVRDEVELDKLTGRLVEVVDATMQPEYVALWLRETAPGSPRVTNQGGQAL
jgi:hypothetical protein